MKSLWLVIALLGQFEFQPEQLPSDLAADCGFSFHQEELPQEVLSKEASKPELELLSAPWCGACQGVKQTLERIGKENLPFTYRVRNVDSEGWLGASSIPAFAYRGVVIQYGFSTPENLMSNLLARTKLGRAIQKATNQRLSSSQLKTFASRYNGPQRGVKGGDYWSHLQEGNHGFTASQLQGLTMQECARIHGAHHFGYLTPFSIGGK